MRIPGYEPSHIDCSATQGTLGLVYLAHVRETGRVEVVCRASRGEMPQH